METRHKNLFKISLFESVLYKSIQIVFTINLYCVSMVKFSFSIIFLFFLGYKRNSFMHFKLIISLIRQCDVCDVCSFFVVIWFGIKSLIIFFSFRKSANYNIITKLHFTFVCNCFSYIKRGQNMDRTKWCSLLFVK